MTEQGSAATTSEIVRFPTVVFEETGERREVVRDCKVCLVHAEVYGSGVVSPTGIAHIAEYEDTFVRQGRNRQRLVVASMTGSRSPRRRAAALRNADKFVSVLGVVSVPVDAVRAAQSGRNVGSSARATNRAHSGSGDWRQRECRVASGAT